MTSESDVTPLTYPAGNDSTTHKRSFAESPFLWFLGLILLDFLVPFLPVPGLAAARLYSIVLVVVYVIAVIQLIVQFARLQWRTPVVATLFIVSLVLWYVLDLEHLINWGLIHLNAQHRLPPGMRVPAFCLQALYSVALLCAAALGGSLLSKLVSEPNMLAPICGLIIMIDIWGVLLGGIVAQMMAKAPRLSQKAMAAVPTAGAATGSKWTIPLPDIGAGDYLFLGLLFTALVTHGMNWRGAVKWVTPLVIVALLSVAFGLPALPGLLFIGLGVAIPNRQFFKFTRDEKFALIWAGVFVAFLTVGLYFAAPSIVAMAVQNEPPKTGRVIRR